MTEPRDTTPNTEQTETGDGKPFPPFTDPGQEHKQHSDDSGDGKPFPPFTDPGPRGDGSGSEGNLSDVGEATRESDTGPESDASRRAARNAADEESNPPDSGMDAVIDEVDQRTSGMISKLKKKLPHGHDPEA